MGLKRELADAAEKIAGLEQTMTRRAVDSSETAVERLRGEVEALEKAARSAQYLATQKEQDFKNQVSSFSESAG